MSLRMMFSFFVWISLISYTLANQCVSPALVKPCVCSSNGAETFLTCNNVTKQTYFSDLIRNSKDYQFDYLLLKHSSVDYVPRQLLAEKSFTSVRIAKSNLSDLFDEGSVQVNNLESLIIETVILKNGYRWEQLRNIPNLKKLLVKNVNVPALDDKFVDNVSQNLEHLTLLRTNTSRLIDNTFTNMSHLTDIIIQESEVTELKRSMFANISLVRNFFFDGNRIEILPDNLFSDMPLLLRVGLKNNRITNISEKVFHGIYDHLLVLLLEGNPISCDCSFKWIVNGTEHNPEIYITGMCDSPKEIKGRELSDLVPYDFSCCP
ncbi:LRRCT domain-containing protein [Trichonephila clavata]|uniref:LRRCT domain-containing protein n=1 Tax=Trichonephila clavata TaxID=2740835 RepID=A0A8X6HND1_TRICU|nr:LRRCT domain-containing protein [Trichonephila clavata]